MSGRLTVIGLGPGPDAMMTGQAREALERATHLFGYGPYLARLSPGPGQSVHVSDNREELARAGAALDLAAGGAEVAMVSGGDPGVFAMAAAVCEAVEAGPAPWRDLDIEVVPGVTAMLAVAAAVGAPLGHDFCAINLSDNLKPADVIARRVEACAAAGLVMAFYNPVSRARPHGLDAAFEAARRHLAPHTPVLFGRAAGRPDERMTIVTLAEARGAMADMATCVVIGSAMTRLVERPGRPPLLYTPRSWPQAAGGARAAMKAEA